VILAGDILWYIGVLSRIVACVTAHKWKAGGWGGGGGKKMVFVFNGAIPGFDHGVSAVDK
jgi:hypothetical protein